MADGAICGTVVPESKMFTAGVGCDRVARLPASPIRAASDRAQALRILQVFTPSSGVVHRTDLPGQHSGTAFVVGIRGGHILAAERERRGGDTRHLAHQPAANHPRKMPADEGHGHVSLPRRFAGMMEAIPVWNLCNPIFVSVVVCLCVSASTASAQERPAPGGRPRPGDDGAELDLGDRRQRVLRLQLPAAAVRRLRGRGTRRTG